MKLTQNYKIFLGVVLVLFLINLFIANDVAVIWDGPEAWRVWQMQKENFQLFWWRFPGPVFLCLGFLLFWFLSQKIFGSRSILLALVVLGASLLVPNLAKQAILDSWLLCFQIGALLALLRYLKQAQWLWQILFYGFLIPSLWLAPLNSLLTFGVISTALYFFHPQGKRFLKLLPWLAIVIILGALYLVGHLDWSTKGFFIAHFQNTFLKNLGYQFLGFLPFAGFILAGLWEVFQKVRKREEFSIILLCWLIAALIGQSLLLSMGLALLVAKQMDAYFIKQYPYRSIVKTGAILQVLLAFLGLTFLMLRGFYEFRGMGFRAALAFGALYWMPALIAVIGLYGMNRRFVLGGTIFSALMATLFFWVQLYPLLYTRLNWKEEAIEQVLATADGQDRVWVYQKEGGLFPALLCYAKKTFSEVTIVKGDDALESVISQPEERPLIFPLEALGKDTFPAPFIEFEAWNTFGFIPKKYILLSQ